MLISRYVSLAVICLALLAISLSGCGSSSSTASTTSTAPPRTVGEVCAGLKGSNYAVCASGYSARLQEEASGTYTSNSEKKP